jgi:hypothetical protein
MDTLTKLFGSGARVKIMRLFLFNPEITFSIDEVVAKTKCSSRDVRKELLLLKNVDLVKKRIYFRDVAKKIRKKLVMKKIKSVGFHLDAKFPYLNSLRNLLTVVSLDTNEDLVRRFSSLGRVKLLLVAGVFTQEWDSRVDLLVVADGLSPQKAEHIIKGIEAELGKELSYTALDTNDFEYRLNIHDKLVRDILDFPYKALIDKIGLHDPAAKI